jgi:hypothetical protein
MRRLACVVLLLAMIPLPAGARSRSASRVKPPPALEMGARVRVTLLARRKEPVIGTLLALPPGRIEYEDSTQHSVPRRDVAKLEISRGMHSRAGRYARFGALAFGTLGAVSGAQAGRALDNSQNSAFIIGVVGGAAGALIGAGLGALVGGGIKDENWVKVRLPKEAP